jgi:uncharacterized protein
MVPTLENPALKHFHAVVARTYGDRLERVILYGSRARGDAQPDSDYDVAVFLRDMNDTDARMAELNRLAKIETDILYDTGEVICAMPYPAGFYNDESMPLMHEIRREGIDL